MKIALVATHSFPIPCHNVFIDGKYVNIHTGDFVILQLANALAELGHEIYLVAPEGSKPSNKVTLLSMMASYGKYPPSSETCENDAFNKHKEVLLSCDVIHDFSTTKMIADNFYNYHQLNINPSIGKNVLSTIMGGPWTNSRIPHNVVGWSKTHADRIIRGATDYEGTPTPDLAGHTGKPVKDVRVVNGGVDTKLYYPNENYQKNNKILWMGRWSKVRGYSQAVEIAKANPHVEFIFAGGKPEDQYFAPERECAKEAEEQCKDLSNVTIKWLPTEPNQHHFFKRKLYQEAKAFLYNVQFCEPFGLMQAESLACGTPVIGTNYGSVSEVVEHGITGYVCDNNISSFSSAISVIDKINPIACREAAVRRFDITIMAKNYLEKYQEIINGRSWG